LRQQRDRDHVEEVQKKNALCPPPVAWMITVASPVDGDCT